MVAPVLGNPISEEKMDYLLHVSGWSQITMQAVLDRGFSPKEILREIRAYRKQEKEKREALGYESPGGRERETIDFIVSKLDEIQQKTKDKGTFKWAGEEKKYWAKEYAKT